MGLGGERRRSATAAIDSGRSIASDLAARIAKTAPSHDVTAELERHLPHLGFDDVGRFGSSSLIARRPNPRSTTRLLVVGSHDRSRLSPSLAPDRAASNHAIRGRGAASQTGPWLAFLSGACENATPRSDARLDLVAVSLGAGDTIGAVTSIDSLDGITAVVCTEAINWEPDYPTITTGSRGRLEATISISAETTVNDRAYAGASLNPLNHLVDVLAQLRGESGRVGLPGFYDRAIAPDRNLLGRIESSWASDVGVAAPAGKLTLLERASQWPTFSVLSMSTDPPHPTSMPAHATASVSFGLVPDQRPVDIERSLRRFVAETTPSPLRAMVRIVESARPHASRPDDEIVAVHASVAKDLTGRQATLVPAGGMIGAGELHFHFGAPVVHMGIAGPRQRWGTTDEIVPSSLFAHGQRSAARFVAELERRVG